MLISLTVGKVDAGVAVLLTEDKRLIEFPSILLPPSITSGSIVDITVSRNTSSEQTSQRSFKTLQTSILQTYGLRSPSPPVLRLRNATQTSVVLEWDKLDLATASLRSLSLYRNGAKAGTIPRAVSPAAEVQATKVSGLAVDTEYVFHLVLRTTAGMYTSEKLAVRTHKMTDLSGITVTPGILPPQLRSSLDNAIERIGGKMADGVRIDTTHFVTVEGRGREWERAGEMNIPVVRPEWVEGCEREGRIVGVRGYYLNADPKLRQVGQGVGGGAGGGGESPRTGALPVRERGREGVLSARAGGELATPRERAEGRPGSNEGAESGGPPPPLPEKDTPVLGGGEQEEERRPSVEESEEEEEEEKEERGRGGGKDDGEVSPLEREEEDEEEEEEGGDIGAGLKGKGEKGDEGEGESGSLSEVAL